MKVLNLYACLGGNRYKWNEVKNDIEVTAIELDEELAEMYKKRFPNDNVIVTDAHQYLLKHYKEYDFIWSSPPCPTHSKLKFSQKNKSFYIAEYPNMSLYQEIIFLSSIYKGIFCVENVKPYYKPLINAQERGRHLYWCNFKLPTNINERKEGIGLVGNSRIKNELQKLCKFHEIDLTNYNGKYRKLSLARNLVDYQAGKTIFEIAINKYKKTNNQQIELF